MAKNILPTNYQDDIMNESAGGKRKYRMIYNEDGTVSFDDLTVYDLEGSDYGAGDINRTNEAVNQSADAGKIIDDPDTAEATTEEGYIAGVQLFNNVNRSLNTILNKTDEIFINASGGTIATISTAGGSWTATQDCYCKVTMGSNAQSELAKVYLDNNPIIATNIVSTNQISYPFCGGFYVKKGQVVKTESGSHKYQITFMPLF